MVDDNEADARLVESYLETSQLLQVHFRHVEGLKPLSNVVKEVTPDLILLDLNLPESEGTETFDHVRLQLPFVPIIILSALDDDIAGQRLIRRGARDYLVKGRLTRDVVERSIRYTLDTFELQRKLNESSLQSRRSTQNKSGSTSDLSGNEALLALDTAGRVCYANQQAALLLGKSSRQIIGAKPQLHLNGNASQRVEIRNAEGKRRVIEANTIECEWKDSEVRLISLKDVTERLELESSLRDSDEKFRAVFENALDVILIVDCHRGTILECNRAADFVLGYEDRELIGRPFSSLFPEKDTALSGNLGEHLSVHGPVFESLHFLRADGSECPMDLTAALIPWGRSKAILTTLRDVSSREAAELGQRKAEEKYRSIVENAIDGIAQIHSSGQILTANTALAQILGYSSSYEMMRNVHSIASQHYVEPQEHDELVHILETQNSVRGYECEMVRLDGTHVFVSQNARAVRDSKGRISYYEGSMTDLTEKQQLEEQLRQSQKMEAIGRLAGGVAHDFNNLLSVIRGYCELLRMRSGEEHEFASELAEIQKAGDRASALTRQLLIFSRKQILQPQVLNLNFMIRDLTKMLWRLIGEDTELETLLNEDLGLVKADPGQMEQVLMNLVVNAKDAFQGSGGKISIRTRNMDIDTVESRFPVEMEYGNYVVLEVEDEGCGMDEETLTHIFEPFFTTKGERGTGLGLSTVHGIVSQSGGFIVPRSRVGEGTLFTIYFPRIDDEFEIFEEEEEEDGDLRGGHETVLLVEDEPQLRSLLRGVLTTAGYKVLDAGNGPAAVEESQFYEHEIHLLITDVVMPKMSGRELARTLQDSKRRKGMPVIFLSGYSAEIIDDHGALEDGIELMQKPVSPAALLQKVRDVLDRRKDPNGKSRVEDKSLNPPLQIMD